MSNRIGVLIDIGDEYVLRFVIFLFAICGKVSAFAIGIADFRFIDNKTFIILDGFGTMMIAIRCVRVSFNLFELDFVCECRIGMLNKAFSAKAFLKVLNGIFLSIAVIRRGKLICGCIKNTSNIIFKNI